VTGSSHPLPLIAASKNGHNHVVELLLCHGADVNSVHSILGSPLYAGCDIGEFKIARMLLDHKPKADIDMKTPAKFCFPLQVACVNGQDETVDLLLERGASTQQTGGACVRVLNAACWGCRTATVQRLISKGAVLTTVRGEYGTALEAAADTRNIETAKLLLEAGSNWGYALIDACRVGDEEMVQYFMEYERESAENRAQGATSPGAERKQILEAMKRFVNITAAEDGTSFGDVSTPLAAACSACCPKIVTLLLDNGAEPNTKGGGKYEYPLLFAIYFKDGEIAHLLLDRGVSAKEAGEFSQQRWRNPVQTDTKIPKLTKQEQDAYYDVSIEELIDKLDDKDRKAAEDAADPIEHLIIVSRLLGLKSVGNRLSQTKKPLILAAKS
jgi:ankyrin repeat protein